MENAPSIAPVLAFDATTSPASVALRVAGRVTHASVAHGTQAAQLVPAIDRLLRAENLAYTNIGSIVTTIGPGSFTGLRIALAALHGLVLANATPIRLLTSSEAVAWAIARRPDVPNEFLVALDAGKGEVFVQHFRIDNARPVALDAIALHPANMIAGFGAHCFSNQLPPEHPNYISGPDACTLVAIAEYLPVAELVDAAPIYIRPADAKIQVKLSVATNS